MTALLGWLFIAMIVSVGILILSDNIVAGLFSIFVTIVIGYAFNADLSEDYYIEIVETKPICQIEEDGTYYNIYKSNGIINISFLTNGSANGKIKETITCTSYEEGFTNDTSFIEIKTLRLEKEWYRYFMYCPNEIHCTIYIKE